MLKTKSERTAYFYVAVQPGIAKEVAALLERRLQTAQGAVPCSVEVAEKVDLDQPNHLSGIKNKFIKLSFHNVKALQGAKNILKPRIEQNKKRIATAAATGGSGFGTGEAFGALLPLIWLLALY